MTARIVVDAMGGDNAPGEIVDGALMAAGGLGIEVILVGQRAAIESELEGASASNAHRRSRGSHRHGDRDRGREGKPESSINVGLRMVRTASADAFSRRQHRREHGRPLLTLAASGIGRPALATIFPTGEGRLTMLPMSRERRLPADPPLLHSPTWAAYMSDVQGFEPESRAHLDRRRGSKGNHSR